MYKNRTVCPSGSLKNLKESSVNSSSNSQFQQKQSPLPKLTSWLNSEMNEVHILFPWNCYLESIPFRSSLFDFFFFFCPKEMHWQCKQKVDMKKNPTKQQVITSAFLKGVLRCYLHAQDSTVMFGYTLRTTFLFSSKNKILREDILSGTQQGSGIPGMTPTALTMLWMVAWLDGFKACMRKIKQKM